jgi:hypothetical protein
MIKDIMSTPEEKAIMRAELEQRRLDNIKIIAEEKSQVEQKRVDDLQRAENIKQDDIRRTEREKVEAIKKAEDEKNAMAEKAKKDEEQRIQKEKQNKIDEKEIIRIEKKYEAMIKNLYIHEIKQELARKSFTLASSDFEKSPDGSNQVAEYFI